MSITLSSVIAFVIGLLSFTTTFLKTREVTVLQALLANPGTNGSLRGSAYEELRFTKLIIAMSVALGLLSFAAALVMML